MSSSSKELSKFEKEKQKLVQEKCQGLLNEMLRDDDNKYCVDCDAKGPRWASWNLGIFLCIRCAGIHRNLGVHISRVKSVNLDSWTPEQVVTMQQMGNSRARAVYEANLPDNFRRPQTDVALENFIRAKYEHTKYIAQEWVKPPPPRVDWNAEIEEQIRKKKEKKSGDAVVLPPGKVLKSIRTTTKPTTEVKKEVSAVPPPITAAAAQQAPPPTTTSASDDLLGLVVTDDPFASPVKSTNDESSNNDLGSVFTAPAEPNSGKMSKESILSLYGSLGGGAPPAAAAAAISSNNPFAGASMFAAQPQPQQGTYDVLGGGGSNGFGGLISGNNSSAGLSQLQQGLFSLNLGATPQPQQPLPQQFPNSNLFATPPQPQSNLNMLMNNTSTSPFGAFASAPGLVPQQHPPQQQQQQQQNNMFNQFGVFQNGGGPAAPSGGASTQQNIDLLWK